MEGGGEREREGGMGGEGGRCRLLLINNIHSARVGGACPNPL